jgi:hypothetical protein
VSQHLPEGLEYSSYFYIQSYLPASLKGGTTGSTTESEGVLGNNAASGGVPGGMPQESGPRTVDSPYPTSEVHAQQELV